MSKTMRPSRPLHLAQNMRDLNKLVTNPSYGRKLNQLCRVSDKLAQNVFETNLELPVDEERIYILCMRYIHLINTIRIQVQDERFFSTRFASTLKRVEELKENVLKSLGHRYEINVVPISPNEQAITSVLDDNDNMAVKPPKNNIINDDDVFITSNQLYRLMNEDTIKVLVMDARPSAEFKQCSLKFQNTICIPEEIIHKGLSTNTLQQKLSPETSAMFQTRHKFDYIVLADLDTNKISYQTTKLHDLRTILVDWDLEQHYQTLPLILDGGMRTMVDHYPTLFVNPGLIFNQLFHQFDDFIGDDIEYPDVPTIEAPSPTRPDVVPELEPPADTQTPGEKGEKEPPLTGIAQRLLSICEHQVQLEEKIYDYCKRRFEIKRKIASAPTPELNRDLGEVNRQISSIASSRIELEERRRLVRAEFDAKCAEAGDVSYLDYMVKDVASLDKKRLNRYQKRKSLELEESEFEKNAISRPPSNKTPEIKPKRMPVPDRSTKPSVSNTLDLEINTLLTNFANSGVTGLVNIKNTCYMNALVQCLRFCPSIAYFFTMRTFPTSMAMTSALGELVKKLWTENRVAIRPHHFFAEACKLHDHDYSTGAHEDIHEFFVSVTEAMHKELAEPLETSGDCTSYLSDWHKAFKSKISFINRAFYYQLEVTTSCTRCRTSIVKYEYNNNVFLSMEYDGERPIDVQKEVDRTIFPTRAEKYCSRCELEMNVRHRVMYHPNVLVVNLMRYTYSIKDRCVLRLLNEAYFPMELLFGSIKYTLSAIACHSGNRDRGHYTACCYHPYMKKWIEFNDETCTVAKINESALRVRAYMLFYSLSPQHDGINRQFFQS